MNRVEKNVYDAVASEIAQQFTAAPTSDGRAFIRLPVYYPGGSPTAILVAKNPSFAGDPDIYTVSDFCGGYEESEMLGVRGSYVRQAKDVAERIGIAFEDHAFFVSDASREQLAWAAITIANASCEAVVLAAQKVEEIEKEEEGEVLYRRLVNVFSPQHVARNVEIIGSSNTVWNVDAVVNSSYKKTVFESVTKHRNSIYAAVTKFSDIKNLEDAPKRVAVVKRKSELKTLLPVLSSSGEVIEREIATSSLKRLVGVNGRGIITR